MIRWYVAETMRWTATVGFAVSAGVSLAALAWNHPLWTARAVALLAACAALFVASLYVHPVKDPSDG